jgi:hypothetical protein
MTQFSLLFGMLLLVFGTQLDAKVLPTAFHDFSKKGQEYKSLENLRFAAEDVTYSGTSILEAFGKTYPASKYTLRVNINVQTLCVIGSVNRETYEQVPAEFEILIADDSERTIHDAALKSLYDTWSRNQLFSGEYFFSLSTRKGSRDYVVAWLPDAADAKGFYFLWVNGRAAKITFRGFKEQKGWGAIDAFNADILRVIVEKTEIKSYQYPLRVQKRVLKLYKEGFFANQSGS